MIDIWDEFDLFDESTINVIEVEQLTASLLIADASRE